MLRSFTTRLFAFSFSYVLALNISLLFVAYLVRICGCQGIRVCLLLAWVSLVLYKYADTFALLSILVARGLFPR